MVFLSCIILAWILVGHFFPTLWIFAGPFFIPVIISVMFFVKKSFNSYLFVLWGYAMLLLNDYLFRLYGGGIHDDAGRGIMEIAFYVTLVLASVCLIASTMIVSSREEGESGRAKLIRNVSVILFVFLCAFSSYFCFLQFLRVL
jgi:hypothetical protein